MGAQAQSSAVGHLAPSVARSELEPPGSVDPNPDPPRPGLLRPRLAPPLPTTSSSSITESVRRHPGLVAKKAAATAFANAVMGRLNRELEKKYQMWTNIRTEISSLQTDLAILAAVVDDHQTVPVAPRTAVTRVYGEEIL
ncbi:hypothetical protein ZWY2020_011483 [Hordeum vulgare]|nr:hypothetical protein ZWY2020_011483 [Hordeum vulgare]